MSTEVATRTPLESFLHRHDEHAWAETINTLLPDIHEVDRAATQIWFAFFPLVLWRVLEEAEDAEALARKLLLQGKYRLRDQIDSSHTFLYGHRYWAEVKRAVEDESASFEPQPELDLTTLVRNVARRAKSKAKVDEAVLTGIAAVALMTLQQVGLPAFKSASSLVSLSEKYARLSPEQVLKSRAQDDSQGLFGFLRTVDKVWTVTFDEADDSARFKLINGQDLAWAAAADKRDFKRLDERRIEGPIPVECRNASCGTCWVGILGGAEKLSEVSGRERRMMQEFGYINTDDKRPVIRLACITPANGAVSIVIPPWNGFFGKYLQKLSMTRDEETETTDAIA